MFRFQRVTKYHIVRSFLRTSDLLHIACKLKNVYTNNPEETIWFQSPLYALTVQTMNTRSIFGMSGILGSQDSTRHGLVHFLWKYLLIKGTPDQNKCNRSFAITFPERNFIDLICTAIFCANEMVSPLGGDST